MNEGRLKQYLRLIAVSFVAVGCLYFSIDGFLFIHKEVSGRLHIARNGILTDGVIVEKSGRGAAAGPFARYSFHVKGYTNPYLAGQQRFLDSMKKLNNSLPPGVPPLNLTALETNRSTVYGEDLYEAFGVPIVPRTKTPVMYLPGDPEKNIAGDHRGASYWSMTRGYRNIYFNIGLFFVLGLLAAGHALLMLLPAETTIGLN